MAKVIGDSTVQVMKRSTAKERLQRHGLGRICASVLGIGVWVLAASFLRPSGAQESAPMEELQIRRVFADLELTRPVFLTHAGDGSDRIFVVEQPGRIQFFAN